MLVMLSLYSMTQPRNTSEKSGFDGKKALGALYAAKWEIPLPIIVLGGIYGGYIAVSEAAAVTAL